MGILSAIAKYIARTLNDKHYNSTVCKAGNNAYKKTGVKIKKAKKRGSFIDGKGEYKKMRKKIVVSANQRHNRIDKLISEI